MEAKILTVYRQMFNSQHQNKKFKGNHMDVVYQSMEGIYFQEEVLMDILSRLPLRSLLRFKCVSKFWNTLISDPCFAMKTKLSPQEGRDCVDNLGRYLFHLQLGFYKDRKDDLKEFMKAYPLDQKTREFLSYPTGSSDDENTDEEDITDEDEEDDSEYETSASEEYDSEEEVDDVESADGSDDDESADGSDDDESGDGSADANADDRKKGMQGSAEEKVDPRDNNRLFYTLYLVLLFEEMYKDRKADLKEIQVKHPLSRHSKELLGYHSGSDARASEDDITKDEWAAAEEHDSKVVDAAKSVDGPDDYDGDGDASDNGGVAA